jgi:hypothetical protein
VNYQSGTELPHSKGSADLIYAHASSLTDLKLNQKTKKINALHISGR